MQGTGSGQREGRVRWEEYRRQEGYRVWGGIQKTEKGTGERKDTEKREWAEDRNGTENSEGSEGWKSTKNRELTEGRKSTEDGERYKEQ